MIKSKFLKKFLIILTAGLLWLNTSLADDSELNISIKKAVGETDVIKIDERYSVKCIKEAEFEGASFIFSQKVVKSKILKTEMIIEFEEYGKIYFKIDSKIKSNGKLSKTNAKVHYSPDFDKDFKKSIKPYFNMFEQIFKESFSNLSLYGKTLLPIQIEDKKKSKQFLSLMKKMLANESRWKGILKEIKIKMYDHYLGIAEIQSEKFYVLKTSLIAEHPDESFLDEVEELNKSMYTLVHIESGYNFQLQEEMGEEICTIYKQDKELVTIDISEIFN